MDITNIEIKPIKTKEDYKLALKNIEALWDAPPKSKQADILEALVILVEEYENKHFAIGLSDIEASSNENDGFSLTDEQKKILDEEQRKYLSGEGKYYAWEEAKEIIRGKKPFSSEPFPK